MKTLIISALLLISGCSEMVNSRQIPCKYVEGYYYSEVDPNGFPKTTNYGKFDCNRGELITVAVNDLVTLEQTKNVTHYLLEEDWNITYFNGHSSESTTYTYIGY